MKIIIAALFLFFNVSISQLSSLPKLSIEDIDGNNITLEDYTAKGPVYITFWALWCKVCKEELRVLNSIFEKHNDKPFTILAINTDTPRSLAKVKAYVKSQDFSFPVILDPNEQIFQSFNGQHLPFAVLLDKKGNIISVRTGYLPGEEKDIEKEILELINP